ncbi:DUF1697 domain-containing protein [Pendulispora brunnea]|uniref:DUF1697 domain-containing protein n=1 Tax=Pendulispora brunnea TaxID=2905690 RepID=A0ABZ2K8Q0_9BACT
MTARLGGEFRVALLRGINLGSSNRLPMPALVAMFEAAGCVDVRHYIQSGNIVFRANEKLGARLGSLIAKRIAADYGYDVPVILRSAAELREVLRVNPFLDRGTEGKTLHVAFLAAEPDPARVSALDAKRSPPDSFAVVGREIYLYCPNGVGQTKLTNAYFDAKLGTTSTMRNWNTVQKLVAMME